MRQHRVVEAGDIVRNLAPEQPMVNLVGEKTAIGPLRRDLLPLYQQWLNDFSMLAMIDRRFRPITSEWIETWYERHARGVHDTMVFTVWEKTGWRPIGNTSLQDIDLRSRSAEFGLFIGATERRNQGLGTDATRLMLDFGFRILGLENIMLRVYDYNVAARRCYEKVGFREIGRRHRSQFMEGRFWDTIYMECLASDFLRANPPTERPSPIGPERLPPPPDAYGSEAPLG